MLRRQSTNMSTISGVPQLPSDQQSLVSGRKASRLSNLNPMKSRTVSKGDLNVASNTANSSQVNVSNSSYYNLTPTSTNSMLESNYHLTRMETNDSIDSNYSLPQQFKIDLNLSKRDIELIRFTWNKMLLEEPVVQSASNLPIPGGFKFGNDDYAIQQQAQRQASQVSGAPVKTANNIASSLFCRQLYDNLLTMDPQLEKLFPSIKHQAVAFAGVMSFTISQLENLNALNDYLEGLGKRHSRILGIEPSMFELMGEALVQTFHGRFGNKFNQELEILWIKLYLYLANSLLQFGIDPVLKLNKTESFHHNYEQHSFTRTADNSIVHSASSIAREKDNSDLFSVLDDKRSSVSTAGMSSNNSSSAELRSKIVNGKKKKRDCVIQ